MHLEQILKNIPLGVGTPYQKTGLKLILILSKTSETPGKANFLNNSPHIDWTGSFPLSTTASGMIQLSHR